jgi:hypothetical protein
MLLHYSRSRIDYMSAEDQSHELPGTVEDALLFFVSNGLLKSRYSDITWAAAPARLDDPSVEMPIFTITDKGRAMVQHLCQVEIPVCKWVRPSEVA